MQARSVDPFACGNATASTKLAASLGSSLSPHGEARVNMLGLNRPWRVRSRSGKTIDHDPSWTLFAIFGVLILLGAGSKLGF